MNQWSVVGRGGRQGRTWVVTRHYGALRWLLRRGVRWDEMREHLGEDDLRRVGPGDRVIGTLPLHLAAAVVARGAAVWHLDVPRLTPGQRGRELDADGLDNAGARLVRYDVRPWVPTMEEQR